MGQSSGVSGTDEKGGLVRRVFYAPSDIGPAGLTWVIHFASLYYMYPEELRAKVDRRATKPAGAKWFEIVSKDM